MNPPGLLVKNTFLTIEEPLTPQSVWHSQTLPNAKRKMLCPTLIRYGECTEELCRFAHDVEGCRQECTTESPGPHLLRPLSPPLECDEGADASLTPCDFRSEVEATQDGPDEDLLGPRLVDDNESYASLALSACSPQESNPTASRNRLRVKNTFLTIEDHSPTTPSTSPEKARTVPSAQRTTMCPMLCSAGQCLDPMCRFAHDGKEFSRFHAWENRFHMDTQPVQEKSHAQRVDQEKSQSERLFMVEPCGPQSPLPRKSKT